MVVSAALLSMCHWELNGPQSSYLLALTYNWIWPGQLKQQLRFIELLLLVNVLITFPSRSRKGSSLWSVFLVRTIGLHISLGIRQINQFYLLYFFSSCSLYQMGFDLNTRLQTLQRMCWFLCWRLFPRCMEKKFIPRFSTSVETCD